MSASKKLIIPILLTAMILPTSPVMAALTLQQAVNNIQATDPALPTGVANPKGSIGSLLAELFWGTGDGVKNGKIKPQYIDYSGISAWTQSGSNAYYSGTGSVGIGTANPSAPLHVAATVMRLGNADWGQLRFNDGTSDLGIVDMDNNSRMDFYVGWAAFGNLKMAINSSGSVGIGTATPNKLLHLKTPTGTNAEFDIQSGTKPLWGIYHDETSEELRFWNGSNRVVFGSGGNVGIGTTIPNYALTVKTPVGNYGIVQTDGTRTIGLYVDANAGYLWTQSNNNLSFFTNGGAAQMTLLTNGNFGIGTSSPNAKLQIESVTRTTPANQPLVLTSPTTAIGDKLGISFSQTDNYSRARAGIYAISELANGYASSLGFFTRNAEDGTQLDSADEKMRITSGGNVGIGTTSPWARLHLYEPTPSATQSLLMDGAGSTKHRLLWSGGRYLEYSQATGDITLHSNGGDFVLNNLGNVGIGRTDPGSKLDVRGDIRIGDSNNYGGWIKPSGATISTTPTIIGRVGYGGLFVVSGAAGAGQFSDLVFYVYGNVPQVISSKTVIGSPATRTYAASAYDFTLQMSSWTYTVWAIGTTN